MCSHFPEDFEETKAYSINYIYCTLARKKENGTLFSLDLTREALNLRPSLSKYLHQARSTQRPNQNNRGDH